MSQSLQGEVKEAFTGIGATPPMTKPTLTVAEVIEPALLDLRGAAAFLAISVPSLRGEMYAGRLNAKVFGKSKPVFELKELKRYASDLPSWEPK